MLKILADELRPQLAGARVDRIYMHSRDSVLMHVRNESGVRRLLFSARSGMARVHFTEEEYDNPASPPAFCMLLRKYLLSGRIKDVRAVDAERILFFDFDVITEMGDRAEIIVSMEMMGRYSNVVLINAENRVIDAMKRITAEQSDKRQLVPGVVFQMPPVQNGLSFLSSPAGELVSRIRVTRKPLSAAILANAVGVAPVVCREIAYRVSSADAYADTLEPGGAMALAREIDAVKHIAENGPRRLNIVYDADKPVEFSFLLLTQYQGLRAVEYESLSGLLDSYYAERSRAELLKGRSAGLTRRVDAILERLKRRQHARELEFASTEKADRLKLYGELLMANLAQIEAGVSEAEIFDYYSETFVTIPLDPQRTPVRNAQKYYKDYRKLVTARKILGELMEEGRKEIVYIESVRYAVQLAETEEEFLAIRVELKESGYLKSFRAPKKKPARFPDTFAYRSSDGFDIHAGKNNAANDRLTLRTSAKHDMWFHVKNGAGSHVVLVTEGKPPTDTAMGEAAMIAAYHSELRGSSQAPVDYTEIRHVKKAPAQKPGMVIYSGFKTAYVTPDKERLDSLKTEPR